MTKEQKETLELLHSSLENLQTEESNIPEDDGAIVFDGEGVDGPAIGYIEIDGTVTWAVCGGLIEMDNSEFSVKA